MSGMSKPTFDIKDVMLEAQAEAQAMIREILQELALPNMLNQFRVTWAQMPAEMKEKFQRERPEEYAALVELFK